MAPLQFSSYFAFSWSFTKLEGSPLFQFLALDLAPTLAVLGLFSRRILVENVPDSYSV